MTAHLSLISDKHSHWNVLQVILESELWDRVQPVWAQEHLKEASV